MRRTRLYVFLSIFSLVVAGGLAVAQKRCKVLREHRKLTSLFKTNCSFEKHGCKNTKGGPVRMAPKDDADPWVSTRAAMHDRDFEAMSEHARNIPGLRGTMMQAYAQRGLGCYDAAVKLYTYCTTAEVAERDSAYEIDAYIGRAYCNFRLNDPVAAHSDIGKAIAMGEMQTANDGTEQDYYQLACAYAVQSSMLSGDMATEARRKALDQFLLAVAVGFDGWDHAAADLDMDAMRDEPAFKKLVE